MSQPMNKPRRKKKKLLFTVDALSEEIHIELTQIDLLVRCCEIVEIAITRDSLDNKMTIVFTKYLLDCAISLEK